MEFQFDNDCLHFQVSNGRSESDFDRCLKKQWLAAVESGACRYTLTQLQTRILTGKYQLVAQLNVERAKLRRKPQDLQAVNAPFDPSEFNFNKVPSREILLKPKPACSEDGENVIVINISPVEFGNSLLVPSVTNCIPQRVTLEGLTLLIQVMLLSSDLDMRSGFNSPGGYASVNHQHFHLYYLRERLFLETAEVEYIAGPCYALTDFPSKGFAFQLEDNNVALLAGNVHRLASFLRDQSVAHNLFLTRGKPFVVRQGRDNVNTLRVFVWARESTFGVKEEIGFNPALCELAGHLLIKEESTYESVEEDQVVDLLDAITKPFFDQIRPKIASLFSTF